MLFVPLDSSPESERLLIEVINSGDASWPAESVKGMRQTGDVIRVDINTANS